jgi:GTP cyclohydrolase II
MLRALGVTRVALLSNNPDKAAQLTRLGVTVVERVPTGLHLSDANAEYLAAKVRRGAHTIDLDGLRSGDHHPNGTRGAGPNGADD